MYGKKQDPNIGEYWVLYKTLGRWLSSFTKLFALFLNGPHELQDNTISFLLDLCDTNQDDLRTIHWFTTHGTC